MYRLVYTTGRFVGPITSALAHILKQSDSDTRREDDHGFNCSATALPWRGGEGGYSCQLDSRSYW